METLFISSVIGGFEEVRRAAWAKTCSTGWRRLGRHDENSPTPTSRWARVDRAPVRPSGQPPFGPEVQVLSAVSGVVAFGSLWVPHPTDNRRSPRG
jgi:hypothetical protein